MANFTGSDRALTYLTFATGLAISFVSWSWARQEASSAAAWVILGAGVGLTLVVTLMLRARRAAKELAEHVARAEQSEERFRDLTELSSDWFWEQDEQYRNVHMSGGAFDKVGLQRGLYLGRRCWEAPAYGITEEQWEEYRKTLYAHQPFKDVIYQRPDVKGCLRWLSISGKPVFDREGRFNGFRGTGKDITERKNGELRLQVEHVVPRILAHADDLHEVMQELVTCYAETLGWDYGAFWQADPEGFVRSATWFNGDCAHLAEVLPGVLPAARAALLQRALDRGDVEWFEDLLEDAVPGRVAFASATGFYSAVSFPLFAGSNTVGAFEVASRFRRPPDPALITLTRSFAAQIGQFCLRREAERELHHLANHDPLTQLPNRKCFEASLPLAIARARRHQHHLALLFVDLDRFKEINDTLGHDTGDHLLQQVAQRLTASVRETDMVSRLGGDEFVVIAEGFHSDEDIRIIARKLVAAVGEPYNLEGQELHVTASVGIAVHPADGEDVRTLLKHADIAMYRAKEQGRDNFQVYSPHSNPHSVERLAMETQLAKALERGELVLQFQPTVSLATGAPTSMEALLRWQHAERGLLTPAQFMALAEETNLIVPIDRWVLHEACRLRSRWRASSWFAGPVAVNLSARQFLRDELCDDIQTALRETKLPPEALQLEVSESVVMQNPARSVERLQRIKALGVHVTLDDFGAGFSSLALLKNFPIDRVKIDVSLIRDLPQDADSAAITRALIALAHDLRRIVLAEGVETARQLAFLRDHGCDEYQGFLYCRPMPCDDVPALLARVAADAHAKRAPSPARIPQAG